MTRRSRRFQSLQGWRGPPTGRVIILRNSAGNSAGWRTRRLARAHRKVVSVIAPQCTKFAFPVHVREGKLLGGRFRHAPPRHGWTRWRLIDLGACGGMGLRCEAVRPGACGGKAKGDARRSRPALLGSRRTQGEDDRSRGRIFHGAPTGTRTRVRQRCRKSGERTLMPGIHI